MLSRSLEGSLTWISCPSQIATSNQREAKMGSGDWSPGGVWGGNPIVTPTEPQARSATHDESGSEAIPDSAKASPHEREVERGFGDEIPQQVLGIGVTRPLCGIQRDGNRKSQGALARSRSGRVCRRQRTAPLCEFPGSAALSSPLSPLRAKPKSMSSRTALRGVIRRKIYEYGYRYRRRGSGRHLYCD